jgi:hypothetical protein
LKAVDPPKNALSTTMYPRATRIVNVAKGLVEDVVVAIEEATDDLLRTLAELISMPPKEL